jgi:AGZA family xanthine/uracil permease-like MFS transporter
MKSIERFFHIDRANSSIGTETLAGLTTYVTMAYIIVVNPTILANTGMDKGAVMIATCLSAAIGTLLMGFIANYPFAIAPGMGLNAFFAYTICGSMGYTWQAGLAAVFISGIIFIIITLTGLRKTIADGIPFALKTAISAGIGLFIAYIGVKDAGLLRFTISPGTYQIFGDSAANSIVVADSTAVPAFSLTSPVTALAIIGLIITAILVINKVRSALLSGIIVTSVIGGMMQFAFGFDVGITPSTDFSLPSLAPTFGAFISGFGQLVITGQGLGVAVFSIIAVLISLTLVDMFDTIGTLVGTAASANMLDKDGNLPGVNKALLSDAVATALGAVLGTSTVTTYVESSAGISSGGRTGFTSVVTGVLFIASVFMAPFIVFIPPAAVAPVLIIVGVLMAAPLKEINWKDFRIALPSFMTVVFMPFAYSISDGIACGFIFWVVTHVISGRAKEVSGVMYVFSILFVIRYVLLILQ